MSTIDAVNALIENVTDNLDRKLKYYKIDTTNHNILINKHRNIGIRDVCLKLMKRYLFNRKQLLFLIVTHHYFL